MQGLLVTPGAFLYPQNLLELQPPHKVGWESKVGFIVATPLALQAASRPSVFRDDEEDEKEK